MIGLGSDKNTKISLLYLHWSSAGAECVLGVCWYENMNIYAPIPCLTREKLVHCFQYYSCDIILNLLCGICVDQISVALWIGLSGWGCLIAWIVFPGYVKPGFLSKLVNSNWPPYISSVEHLETTWYKCSIDTNVHCTCHKLWGAACLV